MLTISGKGKFPESDRTLTVYPEILFRESRKEKKYSGQKNPAVNGYNIILTFLQTIACFPFH